MTGVTSFQETSMSVLRRGATIWLTGLPSAGKTTIATALAERLRADGHRAEVLDGDEIREFLSSGLGFSREDRHTNVQRIGFVAELLASNGVKVLVPVIAPYADSRDAVRKRHEAEGTAYLEVHVATPVEVCSVRDVKGLYAKQAAGEISGLTGVDDPYEAPETPDLRIETQDSTVAKSAAALHALLVERGLADGAHAAAGPGTTTTSAPTRRVGGEENRTGDAI
jgi:adenylylsulfate kinase